MVSVFKRSVKRPLPAGAVVTQSTKPLPEGATVDSDTRLVTWRDKSTGIELIGELTETGKRMIHHIATWESRGRKRTATVHPNGQQIIEPSKTYFTAYRDHKKRRVMKSTGTTDREDAKRIANELARLENRVRKGAVSATEAKLEKHKGTTLADHLTQYITKMATKAGTADHRDRTRKAIEEIATHAGWKTAADIEEEGVNAYAAEKLAEGASNRTVQRKLIAVKGFTRWLRKTHRLATDPLADVSKPDPATDRRLERRMLKPEEWPYLHRATLAAPERYGMDASERALVYRLAIETGLRSNEIAGLTRGKVVLESDTPHVLCKPAGTKNKKPAKQYITPALAADLAKLIASRRSAKLFHLPHTTDRAHMLRADLSDARAAWLNEAEKDAAELERRTHSDFLAAVDHERERLDFHALRHTCGAWLAIAGEHPKVIQTVMRHASIELTMNTYGHLLPGADAAAVRKIGRMLADDDAEASE